MADMRAVVCDRYGPPEDLRLAEVERPVPAADEVLVRVHAASVNPADLFPIRLAGYVMRRLSREPKRVVLGTDFAGIVEEAGSGVSQFQPGDAVFGGKQGAFAEYVCIKATGPVAKKPAHVSFEAAAAVPIAAMTALQASRDHGHVEAGSRVLINGGSGGVGTFAIQIAKSLGAEVTAVCSPTKVELARSLGADYVVDYTQEDFTQSGRRHDVMLDVAGSHSWSECQAALAPKGTYVLVGVAAIQHTSTWKATSRLATIRLGSMRATQKVAMFITKFNQPDMVVLSDLMESGKLRPVIDRSYTLDQIPEAFRYFEQGHARGKIVIEGIAG